MQRIIYCVSSKQTACVLKFAILFLVFCFIYNPAGSQISKSEAVDIVIADVLSNDTDSKAIYVSRATLPYSDTLNVFDNDFDMVTPYPENWVIYIDLHPLANWLHETLYVAVNADNAEYSVYNSVGYPIELYYYFQIAPRFLPEYDDFKEYSTDFEFTDGDALEIDSDGFSDVVLYNADSLIVFLNDMGDLYPTDTISGEYQSYADLSSNGNKEIILKNGNSLFISALIGNEFVLTDSIIMDYNFTGFECGYVDDNNDVDFILANYYQDSLIIIYNPLNDTSVYIDELALDFNFDFMACGDLDSNGLDDIIINSHIVYSHDVGFDIVEYSDWQSTFHDCINISDFDSDGDNDLLFAYWADSLMVCQNTGNFTFEQITVPNETETHFNDSDVIDINRNGLPYVIRVGINEEFISTEHGVYIYDNGCLQSRNLPQYIPIVYMGENERTLAVGDFDGNGYNDAVIFRLGAKPNLVNKNIGDIIFLYNDHNGNLSNDSLLSHPGSKTKNALDCFPNPLIKESWLKFNNKNRHKASLKIYNSTGSLVLTDVTKENQFIIRNRQFKPGIYMYRLIVGNTNYSGKFIVK